MFGITESITTFVRQLRHKNNMKTLAITTNSNNPNMSFFRVIEETEKAIKIQNTEYSTKIGWLPKKALKFINDYGIELYTFEMWFRKLDNGNAVTKAFNLL